MSVFSRLRATRLALATGVALRALAWGAAVALTIVIGAAIADMITPLSLDVRSRVLVVAIAAEVALIAALIWRDRSVLSAEHVALWVEEQFPSLEYRLVTAVESGDERYVAGSPAAPWLSLALRRSARALGAPATALIAALIVLLVLPSGAVARVRSPHAGDSLDRRTSLRRNVNRLRPLVAELAPPAYTGRPTEAIDDPTELRALIGTRVTLRGRGDGSGIVATAGPDTLLATTSADRWSVAFQVRGHPVAVRLRADSIERIVAIVPVVDQSPVVTLVAPAHDSVLRAPVGRIALAASASDDIGLTTGAFEYIISSGEGETFTFRSGTIGASRFAGRSASLAAAIRLDSLQLKPGDIVHIRAVARDGNTVTGPGVGTSETRAIRIARAGEYDSLAVNAAAPSDAEKGMISERMLIMLTEELQQKRARLARDTLLREAHGIAVDQKRLRRSVGDIVFTRLGGNPSAEETNDEENPKRAKSITELLQRADSATAQSTEPIDFQGGESPVVAVNKPLLEAYNAMWDASLNLEQGDLDRALPHMRRALAAIQQARQAERLYLRGAQPSVVVDIGKIRMAGKEQGASSLRRPRTASDSAARARADRFARIVMTGPRDPRAAADSLLLLRIDALADAPAFAAALGDAVAAMRAGNGSAATSALAHARRLLAGAPVAQDSLGRWGILP